MERFAPGFRETILARSAWGPAEIEGHNRNLVGGDINCGAMDLGQLFTRPVRSRVPYRTPLEGVYLCSRRDAARRRRPRDVRRVGRPGRPGRPVEARVTSLP